MKTAHIKFKNEKYNYSTNINPKCTNKEIKTYFVNTVFNVGSYPLENMQECINCEVE